MAAEVADAGDDGVSFVEEDDVAVRRSQLGDEAVGGLGGFFSAAEGEDDDAFAGLLVDSLHKSSFDALSEGIDERGFELGEGRGRKGVDAREISAG